MGPINYRPGDYDQDHKRLCAIARMDSETKGFCDVYYPREYYENGWIWVAESNEDPVGFVCIRHCVKRPYTSLYYMGVRPFTQGRGIGTQLLECVKDSSPWGVIELGCSKTNEDGLRFWQREGFEVFDQDADKKGNEFWRLRWKRDDD